MEARCVSSLRRRPYWLALLVGVSALLSAVPAGAVVIHPGVASPADRPDDALVGRLNDNASCVVIGPQYVISTRHEFGAGDGVGSVVQVGGVSYTVSRTWTMREPNSPDLWGGQLAGANFTQYARINAGAGEASGNWTVVIGGYGMGRGATLCYQGDPEYPFGYQWDGNGNDTLRWGRNKIDSVTSAYDAARGLYTNLLVDDFDGLGMSTAVSGEAALAEYDSGGGWFRKVGQDWYLVGLSWGTDHADLSQSWFDDPNSSGPEHNYAVRISDYADWINARLAQGGEVPEPAALAVLLGGGAVLLFRRRRLPL